MRLVALSLSALVVAGGCAGGGTRERAAARPAGGAAPADAVLYTKGLSTDPHGESSPHGFGVVLGIGTPQERRLEVSRAGLGSFGGADWIGAGRILVPRPAPPLRRPLLYRLEGGDLTPLGPAPLPALEIGPSWSPDGRLVASEPVEPCRARQRSVFACYRGSARVLVRDAGGGPARRAVLGHSNGWTPDGRLLVTDAGYDAPYEALEIRSGRRTLPLSPERAARELGLDVTGIGPPRWSADGRYVAAMVGVRRPRRASVGGAFLVGRSDGRLLRIVGSPYAISMFAWSPVGHRLAYTTSGFPDPHELFVLEEPEAEPRRVYATAPHFDWITWSPDGRRLLLDEEQAGRWRVFGPEPGASRTLPRPGGRPLWCCPVNAYSLNW